MTSTPLTGIAREEPAQPLIVRPAWPWLLAIGFLFVLMFRHFLQRTWLFATTDNNWSHALIVPLIALFFVYQHRHQLARTAADISWWGLPLFFAGIYGYAMGIFPVRNDMVQGYSMILALFGLALFTLGWRMMAVLWFPILYLAFGVKVSDRIWEAVAFQLQQIAATGATGVLYFFTAFFEYDVAHRGSTINLSFFDSQGNWVTEPINVVEACSGLRMLMAFLALGVALAFLWARPWWQRVVMVLMAVPIAVLVNVGRVSALGLLYLVNPEYARGDLHTFVGMLMLIPAALLFLLLGWVMDRIVIREEESEDQASTGGDTDAEGNRLVAEESGQSAGAGPVGARLLTFAGLGALAGVGLALFSGLAYAAALSILSDDLLLASWSMAMRYGLLGLAGVGVVGALVGLVWLMPRHAAGRPLRLAAGAGTICGVLGSSVIGQAAIIEMTETVLIKEPVELRNQLILMPERMGNWVEIHQDPPLSREMREELGTDQYLSRWYRDENWPEDEPGAIVRWHVAYYTGTPDTVPHVPDRCFVGAGMEFRGRGSTELTLSGPNYAPEGAPFAAYVHPARLEATVPIPSRSFSATRFTYAQPESDHEENVVYFFVANGQYLATPEEVRVHAFDPRDRYSYYCKVEVQVRHVDDPEKARQRASDFLSSAMPELMAALPDWRQVQAGEYPPQAAD